MEPQQEARSLHPVSCCGWKLSGRCHWSVGWDGRKLTGPISAGEKRFVIRIKPYNCQSCNFFSTYYGEQVVWPTLQRIKVLLSEDGSHLELWPGRQMEKGRA